MTSLLLIISFLLHIITLFAVYQLFKQFQSKQTENSSSEEVMEVLETYLEEIKAENNRLQQIINEEDSKRNQFRKEQHEEPVSKNFSKVADNKQSVEEKDGLDELLNELPVYDIDTSLESRVLQLHSKGKDIETIAKQLNCGKTEAELIIMFHQ